MREKSFGFKTEILKKAVKESCDIFSGIVEYVDNMKLGIQSELGVLPAHIQAKDGTLLTGLQIFSPVLRSPSKHCTLFYDDFAERIIILYDKMGCRNLNLDMQQVIGLIMENEAHTMDANKRRKIGESIAALEELMGRIVQEMRGKERRGLC